MAAVTVCLILLLCLAGEAVRRFFHINEVCAVKILCVFHVDKDASAAQEETLVCKDGGKFPESLACHISGTDFLACAGKEHFDLVFLDIYMGNENGMDTANHLRRFDPDCLLHHNIKRKKKRVP